MASRKRRSQTQNHVKVKQNESKKNNTQNIKRSLKNKSYTFNKRHTESSNSSSSIEEEKNTGMRREEKRSGEIRIHMHMTLLLIRKSARSSLFGPLQTLKALKTLSALAADSAAND